MSHFIKVQNGKFMSIEREGWAYPLKETDSLDLFQEYIHSSLISLEKATTLYWENFHRN